jgi:hypothetical protein
MQSAKTPTVPEMKSPLIQAPISATEAVEKSDRAAGRTDNAAQFLAGMKRNIDESQSTEDKPTSPASPTVTQSASLSANSSSHRDFSTQDHQSALLPHLAKDRARPPANRRLPTRAGVGSQQATVATSSMSSPGSTEGNDGQGPLQATSSMSDNTAGSNAKSHTHTVPEKDAPGDERESQIIESTATVLPQVSPVKATSPQSGTMKATVAQISTVESTSTIPPQSGTKTATVSQRLEFPAKTPPTTGKIGAPGGSLFEDDDDDDDLFAPTVRSSSNLAALSAKSEAKTVKTDVDTAIARKPEVDTKKATGAKPKSFFDDDSDDDLDLFK